MLAKLKFRGVRNHFPISNGLNPLKKFQLLRISPCLPSKTSGFWHHTTLEPPQPIFLHFFRTIIQTLKEEIFPFFARFSHKLLVI